MYLIIAIAAVLRFWDIADVPPGIWLDEGRAGRWAARFLAGEGGWGLPEDPNPLVMAVYALAFKWFGTSLVVSRCATALAGTLTVAAWGWALMPALGARAALAAAACLAVMRWHVLVSRIATNYAFLPLVWALALGCLVRAWQTGRDRWWVAAGALSAAALYVYLPGRALPVLVLGAAAFAGLRGSPERRRGFALAVAACAVVCVPLVWHLVASPMGGTFRLRQLAGDFAASPLRAGAAHVMDFLGVFHVRGDGQLTSSFPNPPSAPALGVFGGLLLLGGVVVTAYGRGPWRVLVALWAALLAGITIVTGLSQIRLVSATLLVAALQGSALAWLAAHLKKRRALVLLVAAATIGWEESRGFLTERWWRCDPAAARTAFFAGHRRLAFALEEVARTEHVVLSPETARPGYQEEATSSTVDFLVLPFTGRWSPRDLSQLRPGWVCAAKALSEDRRELLEEVFPGGHLITVAGELSADTGAVWYLMRPGVKGRMTLDAFAAMVRAVAAAWEDVRLGKRDLANASALVAKHPGASAPWVLRGNLRLFAGDLSGSAADANRAVRLSRGRNAAALALSGQAAAAVGDFHTAAGRFEASLALHPGQEPLWRNLVVAWLKLGDRDRARAVLASALAVFPDSLVLRELSAAL